MKRIRLLLGLGAAAAAGGVARVVAPQRRQARALVPVRSGLAGRGRGCGVRRPDGRRADRAEAGRGRLLRARPRPGRSSRSSTARCTSRGCSTDLRAAESSINMLIYGFKPGDIGSAFRDVLLAKVAGGDPGPPLGRRGRERGPGGLEGALRRARGRAACRWSRTGGCSRTSGAPGTGRPDRLAAGEHRPLRPPQVHGRRRPDRLARRDRARGPLQRRAVHRRDGPLRGPGGPPAPGAVRGGLAPPGGPARRGRRDDGPALPAGRRPDVGPGVVPATLLVNVPGTGHVPISEAYEQVIEAAERRVDLVNPYISERPILDRLVQAAERGVAVRIVVPGKPTPPMPAAAFRHNVPRLPGGRGDGPLPPDDGPRQGHGGGRPGARRRLQPRRAQPLPQLGAEPAPGGRRRGRGLRAGDPRPAGGRLDARRRSIRTAGRAASSTPPWTGSRHCSESSRARHAARPSLRAGRRRSPGRGRRGVRAPLLPEQPLPRARRSG